MRHSMRRLAASNSLLFHLIFALAFIQSAKRTLADEAAPMLTMSGETSSSIESAAPANSDDLMAAESSQSPEVAAEHKAFTSGQMLRQEPPQHMVSVAPAFVRGQPQPQPQQQQQVAPNQHPVFPQPHMAARLQPPHKANFNPFMAAALAGNYGPAQQQIAAAALHAQQQGGQVGPPPPHHPYSQHQPPPAPQAHLPQHLASMHQQQQQHAQMHHQNQQPQPQQHYQPPQQQQHQMGVAPPQPPQPQQQVAPQQQADGVIAAQESSIRHNVALAPAAAVAAAAAGSNQFIAADSNSVEMNEVGPQAPSGALVGAASAQHPVVAGAGSSTAVGSASGQEHQAWPLQAPDIPKIVNLEVKCEKNLMKVSVEFDKVFNGVVFSKGHFNHGQCVHVGPNSNKQQAYFDISINSCGTQGNTQNGLYGMGQNTGSGTFFENTIVIQYDPNVQEVYDHARKLRCTWHDQYEKAVTFRPFPVDMLDIVRADFAGDNVGCWMQIQVGKGPWASEVAGIVKIGQTMTMVLAIKDEENKFDMLVRNCFAHDGKRGPIELVDKSGCITRPKLMSRFTKIKNFGSSATVLSYAHFQAFKFPDSMEVHFQCTIQICRHQCPEQCAAGPNAIGSSSSSSSGETYSESTISGTFNINARNGASSGQDQTAAASSQVVDSVHLRKYGAPALARARRDLNAALNRRWPNGSHHHHNHHHHHQKPLTQSVGLNRIIQVVSTGDLAFAVQRGAGQEAAAAALESTSTAPEASQLTRLDLNNNQICMSSYNFVLALVMLVLILLCSCLLAVSLYVRQRSLLAAAGGKKLLKAHQQQQHSQEPGVGQSRSSSILSRLFQQETSQQEHVPSQQQQQQHYSAQVYYQASS